MVTVSGSAFTRPSSPPSPLPSTRRKSGVAKKLCIRNGKRAAPYSWSRKAGAKTAASSVSTSSRWASMTDGSSMVRHSSGAWRIRSRTSSASCPPSSPSCPIFVCQKATSGASVSSLRMGKARAASAMAARISDEEKAVSLMAS